MSPDYILVHHDVVIALAVLGVTAALAVLFALGVTCWALVKRR